MVILSLNSWFNIFNELHLMIEINFHCKNSKNYTLFVWLFRFLFIRLKIGIHLEKYELYN